MSPASWIATTCGGRRPRSERPPLGSDPPRVPRLRWAARLLVAGLLIELPTLFWPHTVSFFLFLGGGALLAAAGMALYLYSVVTLKE